MARVAPLMRIGFPNGVKTSYDPSSISPAALWESRDVRSDDSGILRTRKGVSLFADLNGFGKIQGMKSAFDGILAAWSRNLYLIKDGVTTLLGTNVVGKTTYDDVSFIRWARGGAPISYIFDGATIFETNGTAAGTKQITPYTPATGEKTNLIQKTGGGLDLTSGPVKSRFAVLRASLSQRLAVAGNPDAPNTVWLSAPLDATYFPSDQVIQLPDDGGKIVGLENWYGALVIFRDKDIWCFFGSDLSDAGASLVLQDGSVGCVAGSTIVTVPDVGIVFLGPDNVYAMQGLSGIEDKAKPVAIGDDVRKPLRKTMDDSMTGVSAVYYEREYRLSFPAALNEYRVFRLHMQNGANWYMDSGPKTATFLSHDGQLYGSDLNQGQIYKFDESLTDQGEAIHPYMAFRREDLQPGPARVKRLFIYVLQKGRTVITTTKFFAGNFDEDAFNVTDVETVNIQTGTDQDLTVTLVVDGEEFTVEELTVHSGKVQSIQFATMEPVKIYEARFRPSLKAHFVQVRINAKTSEQDISVLGYGLEYSTHGRIKGSRKGVTV